jgi:hypothetical protein
MSIMMRITAALVTIPLAFALTYLSAWGSPMRWLMENGIASGAAARMLRPLGEDLADYAKATGRYPQSLKELSGWAKQESRHQFVDEFGQLNFGAPYDKVFRYQMYERSYRIYSVGRDAEIGGLELNGDLDKDPMGTVHNGPTVYEFLYRSPYGVMLSRIALTSSVVAGIVCFFFTKRSSVTRGMTIGLCVVVMTAIFVIVSSFVNYGFGVFAAVAYFFFVRRLRAYPCSLRTLVLSIVLTATSAAIVSLFLVFAYMIVESH